MSGVILSLGITNLNYPSNGCEGHPNRC